MLYWNLESNLLPPLYYEALKELHLSSNILEGKYNAAISKQVKISNRRRVILPELRYEIYAKLLVHYWIQSQC